MSTSASIPTSIYDCTDNANIDADNRMPISPTLPNLQSECNDHKRNEGSVRLPVECSALPSDGNDLLERLLAYRPEHRIRSIFSLQRIAFFMGFNFDDAKKKKVTISVDEYFTMMHVLTSNQCMKISFFFPSSYFLFNSSVNR